MLQAVEYLSARFSRIEESGDLGNKLVSIVRSKQIQAPPPMAPPSRQPGAPVGVADNTARISTESRSSTPVRDGVGTPVPNLPPRPSDDDTALSSQAQIRAQAEDTATAQPAVPEAENAATKAAPIGESQVDHRLSGDTAPVAASVPATSGIPEEKKEES